MAAKLISTGLRYTTLPGNYVRRISDRPRLSEVSELKDFPLIDLSSTDRSRLVQQIHQACARFGFFQNYGYSDVLNRVRIVKKSKQMSKIKNQKRMLAIFRPAQNYNSSGYNTRPLYFLFFVTMMAFFNNVTRVVSHGPPPMVFLNYRGAEVRYNFVSHLIDAFERNEINFFVDNYELRGKDLKNLFVRIEESRIALAIFSTRYTESSWCMDELVKMTKLADQGKLEVIPIFWKVEAEHVSEQEGEFGENFWTLAKKSTGDQIKKWKEGLESISDKMGLSYGGKSSQADFVKEIVKEVQRVIAAIRLEEEENHFGKRTRKNGKCNCTGLSVFKKS